MKKINFLGMSILALLMACFTACENKHDVDHSADIAGIWTCLTPDYAEALVIKADGSVISTGVDNGEYWENVAGKFVVNNGVATITLENGDNNKGHFDIIPGVAFSIYEDGKSLTYHYCANDLADEVLGLWYSQHMAIQTYNADGTITATALLPTVDGFMLNTVTDYKVVGDLLFKKIVEQLVTPTSGTHMASRMVYSSNGTTLGDILSLQHYSSTETDAVEETYTWLRIKQTLDLANKKYDYIKTFITNVDGLDKTINFMGYEFNFAKIDGVKFDKMLKTILFAVEFPDANTIKYSCHYNNEAMALQAPIVVDGNKMTVKMSEVYSAAKDVDLYTFQDQDNTQMHMYMPTYSFVNFFANMQIAIMAQVGELDMKDAAAVKAVFDSIDEAVNTINISFVMTAAK